MKLRLLAALLLLPLSAHAQGYGSGVDGQSVFRISDTMAPLSVSGSAVRSPVIASDTRVIRAVSTVDAHIAIGGSSVTATPSTTFLPAYTPEYFKLPQLSAGSYLSVIREAANGTLYIDRMKP